MREETENQSIKIELEDASANIRDIANELVDEIDKIKFITTDKKDNLVVVTEYKEYVSDFPNRISRIIADKTDKTFGAKITSLDRLNGEKTLVFIENPESSKAVTLLYSLALGIDVIVASQMAEQDSERPKSDLPERIINVAENKRFDTVSELKNYMSIT